MLNTLSYVKKLEALGVPRKPAEGQVEIMTQIVDSNYATKQDLKDLGAELRLEIRDATMLYGKMLFAAVGIIIVAMGLMLKL